MRDFNYVDDVVDAFLMAASDPRADGQIFNLGSEEVVSLRALADLLVAANGGVGEYRVRAFPADRKKIDIGDYYSDASLIANSLGWRPETNLAEGLKRTLDYYRGGMESYL